jgi:hypothetical protein
MQETSTANITTSPATSTVSSQTGRPVLRDMTQLRGDRVVDYLLELAPHLLARIGAWIIGAVAVVVFLLYHRAQAAARCPKCSKKWAMRPIDEWLKTVTRPTLVADVRSKQIVERKEEVAAPLSRFEVLHRCRYCGYAEVRTKLGLDEELGPPT